MQTRPKSSNFLTKGKFAKLHSLTLGSNHNNSKPASYKIPGLSLL